VSFIGTGETKKAEGSSNIEVRNLYRTKEYSRWSNFHGKIRSMKVLEGKG
jgi:hypothetical protein